MRKKRPKIKYEDLKNGFIDMVITEYDLGITDEYGEDNNEYFIDDELERGYLLDSSVDNPMASLLCNNERKYYISRAAYPILDHRDIDFNPLFDGTIMRYLTSFYLTKKWLPKYNERNNANYQIHTQIADKRIGSARITYRLKLTDPDNSGEIITFSGDGFYNESVAMFSLITKLNGTDMRYTSKLKSYDVVYESSKDSNGVIKYDVYLPVEV